MEYIYAAGILNELDEEINEENLKAVLNAAGADVSESRVKALVAALEGVDIEEEVAQATPAMGAGEAAAEMEAPEEGVEEADETKPVPADEDAEAEEEEEEGGIGDLF